jgi:arylsulfatase A-like enzyme
MKLILFTLFILTTSLSHSSPFPLWDENIPVPKKAELEVLDDVDFHVIKKRRPDTEGVGNWDGHKKIYDQYPGHAHILDQSTATLIKDLKRRGLLEETLVVFCTEFGRMPTFQKGASGRDHNPFGFTGWLAGAGVKAPFSYGATDDFGWKAAENISSVYDFHATILHLLSLNHEQLSFYHNGIERRLTDVHGHVIKEVLA